MVRELGCILPLPASPEPDILRPSCSSVLPPTLPAEAGHTVFQPEQCSWSRLNSTQTFFLHPAPWSAETARRTPCSLAFWSWFLEGGSRTSRVPQRDALRGLGPRTCRRNTLWGRGGHKVGCPASFPVLVQWPARPSRGVLGAAESKAPSSQVGQGVRMKRRWGKGCGGLSPHRPGNVLALPVKL